ncbi:MAG: ferrous iron transport protein A [Actinomycetia bacterium]|nr:ferrous iron transport protein A [Actinomycetes bacterium]
MTPSSSKGDSARDAVPIPLGQLQIGSTAVVVGYSADVALRRFAEMGFVPGSRVTAMRTAPLGDPIEYAVMGSRVSIRRRDADLVLVREVP